jgi:poly(hydroxyalkanoate) depolymerase family esterase
MKSLLLSITLVASMTTTQAATIAEVTGFGSNPGNLRMFRYLPDQLPAGRPTVVALHGCTQTAAAYGTNAGWIELAQRWRFAVVLPEQQPVNNVSRCFNWFQLSDIGRGQGEAESIAQMVSRTLTDTGGDRTRVMISGLSAGGAMTSVMLATYPDMFAAGGIVAGLPYKCATTMIEAFSCMNPGKNLTPAQWAAKVPAAATYPQVSIWHGTADFTVAQANQRELVEQWTALHGIPPTPTSTDTVLGYPHASYRTANGRQVVETYSITNMGHGQPVDPGNGDFHCGQGAPYLLDVNICAAWHLGAAWQLDS